jgi:uncharacterized protein
MADHPNVRVIRRAVDAFSSGDMVVLAEVLSPDLVVHVPGHSALAGDHQGLEDIFAYNERIFELSEGTYENEIHEIMATDEHGVVLQRNRAGRGDKSLDISEALVMHLKDGKIVEVWEMYVDQDAFDAFWT